MIDQLSVMVLLLLGLAQLLVSSGQQHSSTITSPVYFIFPLDMAGCWLACNAAALIPNRLSCAAFM
jgi:hypothetical protein